MGPHLSRPDDAPLACPPIAVAGARTALILLVLINLFNYIDRQVLAAVEPEIRKELLVDFHDQDAKFRMGLLATAFLVSYMLLSPLFGVLADRFSRWLLVAFGVIVWSAASFGSGVPWLALGLSASTGFLLLLATRCLVGIGEAAYGPVAPAMIADLFPIQRRGMVLAWFYLAIPVGGAIGFAWGEAAARLLSWHWAFYLVLPPGLFLAVLACLMREPPRGQADAVADTGALEHRAPAWADIGQLLRIPSYVLNTIGMTFMSFSIGGLAYWMAAFLDQREPDDVVGLGPRTVFGLITVLAGILSTLSGGVIGDRLRTRFSGAYFLVSGVGLIVGAPMILGIVFAPFPLAWLFVFLSVFCLFFNTGPTNTVLANVTHPGVRARAYALNILVIHLFGDAISPPLIGWIAGAGTLDLGFIVVAAVTALGGVVWLCGTRFLGRDTRLALTRLS